MSSGKTCAEPTAPEQSAKRIASWNSDRDCWETDQIDLLSGLSDVYSETFTISGSMRNGVAYEHQTPAPRISGSESSFSQPAEMLPTPVAQPSGNSPETHLRKKPGREVVTDLAIIVENGLLETDGRLLPTPEAKLAVSGPDCARAGRDGSGGHDLATAAFLLPTPAASDSTGVRVSSEMGGVRESGSKRSVTLATAVHHELLPTPKAGDADFGIPRTTGRPPEKSTHLLTRVEHTKPVSSWGPYTAAIERWEAVLGRPAPEPTEIGPKGGRRLSAPFVEWMMGLPDGWVTDPEIGLSRTEQLRALGNGVVTRQCLYALQLMTKEES